MKFLCALCVLCGLSVSAFSLDREAFTITKYDLEIRIEPEQQRLGGRGTVTLRNDSTRPQQNAVLQISSSLSWRSIKVAGKPVQFVAQDYVSDIDHTGALSEAIVALPVELKPQESVEVEVGYEGTIALDATRLNPIDSIVAGDYVLRHTFGPVLWKGKLTNAELIGSGDTPTLTAALSKLGVGAKVTGQLDMKVIPGKERGKIVVIFNYNQ